MYNIGIDLGGTKIAIGLVKDNSEIIFSNSIETRTERDFFEILDDIVVLIKLVLEKNNLTEKDINSVGIGCPGSCDPSRGIIIDSNNVVVKNINLREYLGKFINIPIFVENDANAAAYGEYFYNNKAYKNMIMLTLGTGVGGGIIIDGKILTGSFFAGGEIGHQVIVVDGNPCTCGRNGCYEAYASATALIKSTQLAAKKNPSSLLNFLISKNDNKINGKIPFDAAKEGDITATKIIEDYIKYLSEGIINLINIFQPEAIIIGGGISGQKENLITPIQNYVENRVFGRKNFTQIKFSELGNSAGIIGAAMLSNQYNNNTK